MEDACQEVAKKGGRVLPAMLGVRRGQNVVLSFTQINTRFLTSLFISSSCSALPNIQLMLSGMFYQSTCTPMLRSHPLKLNLFSSHCHFLIFTTYSSVHLLRCAVSLIKTYDHECQINKVFVSPVSTKNVVYIPN